MEDLGIIELAQLTEDEARNMLEKIRWPNGVVCPHCGTVETATKLQGKKHRQGLWQCNSCREQFTVTTKTVMHRSRVPLVKWILAFHLICSSKKGASALQIKRQLKISYQTSWHMCHRIRAAMADGSFEQMGENKGIVEADEAYFGGKPKVKGDLHNSGRATKKVPILTLVDRKSGKAKSKPIVQVSRDEIEPVLTANIDKSAILMTDSDHSYKWADYHFEGGHFTTNHSKGEYSRKDVDKEGNALDVHSNTAESFFSLLRRGYIGAFHHWGEQHIHRYCAEFDFRWTHRKLNDFERTILAIRGSEGKRLTYNALPTGSNFQ